MHPEERATGTRNEEHNLVSVLYHALHGAETCETYAQDAEEAGDDELASFFRNVRSTHSQVAEQAKTRLYTGNVVTLGTAEVGTSIPPEGITTEPEAPPSQSGVRRGTSPEPPRPSPTEAGREPPPPGPPRNATPPA